MIPSHLAPTNDIIHQTVLSQAIRSLNEISDLLLNVGRREPIELTAKEVEDISTIFMIVLETLDELQHKTEKKEENKQ